MKKNIFLLAAASLILVFSCKKKDDDNNSNSNPCNFATNVLVVEGTSGNIVKSDCKVFGTNYYSEHLIDTGSTSPEGAVMVFSGAAAPAAGEYTAVNDINLVAAGTVYVEYYKIADSWQPSSGKVTVTDSGGSKIYTFCDFNCTQGGLNPRKVSIRATCN